MTLNSVYNNSEKAIHRFRAKSAERVTQKSFGIRLNTAQASFTKSIIQQSVPFPNAPLL